MNVRMCRYAKPKMKPAPKLCDGDQVPTRPVTIAEIMSAPRFAQGVADQRAGRPYPNDYDCWKHTNDRWDYSRGRQWAAAAPRSVALKVNGKISTVAKRWYARGEIL
jgi:hypothetical protein